MKHLGAILCGVLYVTGIVNASGFWMTFLAIIIPPYSWYVAVAHILKFHALS